MKKLLSLIFIVGTMAVMVSCGDDKVAPNHDATISGVSPSVEIDNLGSYGPVTVTVGAEDGLKSLKITKGGVAFGTDVAYTGELTSTVEFSYTAVEADEDKNITFVFIVTDADGDTESATLVISVGAATPPLPNEVLSGVITANQTLTADRIYELAGRVIVDAGVTLTIEAGTIIKGRQGDASLASALIISRGAKIMAVGTAEKPIIFTSVLDNIAVGGVYVGNLKKEDNKTWGGLIMLGNAPISAKAGDNESSIEGLPADEVYGKYGAIEGVTKADDNSGVMKYVSIRHGGALIGEGNEINGLTLGGVGSGTTLENIEIFATLDDGVELFGGTVNIKNLLVVWQGDDGVDIDQNYAGTVDNFVVYHGAGVGTDEGLEIDGYENTLKDGFFTVKNGSLYSDGVEGEGADLKADAQGSIINVKYSGYAVGKGLLKIEGEYAATCDERSSALNTYKDALNNVLTDKLTISGSKFEGTKVYSKKGSDDVAICSSVPSADKDGVAAKFVSVDTATGADTSVFSWTAAVSNNIITL